MRINSKKEKDKAGSREKESQRRMESDLNNISDTRDNFLNEKSATLKAVAEKR